jgi:hypothetical protein
MQLTPTIQVDDFFMLEAAVPVLTKAVGVSVYDFAFRNFFRVNSVFYLPDQPVIARLGAFDDYAKGYAELKEAGISLVHTPQNHDRCSLLSGWYPLIADLTPKSIVYDSLPTTRQVEQDFDWPVFVKGERQTNKHKKSLSIIENAHQFEVFLMEWKHNTMLHWQKMVCRQFFPLHIVEENVSDRLPSSFEFRFFYWKQQLVSVGRYWYESLSYKLSGHDYVQAVELAGLVAKRLSVWFLVVDLAKTAEGNWIVIEVNDGQESGYAGNNARLLWENILNIEKAERFGK